MLGKSAPTAASAPADTPAAATGAVTGDAISAPALRPYTDGSGRPHRLPQKISRIISTSPVGDILLYALAPDLMAGWCSPRHTSEKPFLLPEVRDLPAFGGWFGQNAAGVARERLIAARPDFVLSVGYTTAAAGEQSDRLQRQTGIPVLLEGGRLEEFPATLERLGALLGREKRAGELAAYCRAALADARAFAAAVPPERRRRVYCAEGPRGLLAAPVGSLHSEPLELCGGINVVRGIGTARGRVEVSSDNLLLWQPDVIIAFPDFTGEKRTAGRATSDTSSSRATGVHAGTATGAATGTSSPNPTSRSPLPTYMQTAAWRGLRAVREKRVFVVPTTPFNWLGRPPSLNRFLGLKWGAWALYPDLAAARFDINAETRRFFKLFYHHDLSAAGAAAILDASRAR